MSEAKYWRKYSCSKCGGKVTKTPLKPLIDYNAAEPSKFGGLGKWKCEAGCNPTKVKIELINIVDTRKNKSKTGAAVAHLLAAAARVGYET